MSEIQKPHRHFLRHFLCAVLSILLTASLVITALVGVISMVLFDRGMHENAALQSEVLAAQMNRITDGLTEVCSTYAISPESILPVFTRDSIIQYNRDVITWWMNMVQNGIVAAAPDWDGADLVEIIRADESFQAATPSAMQKATARDKASVEMLEVVSDAVVPVRSLLVSFVMTQVLQRINLTSYTALIRYLPLVTLLLCALLIGSIALIFRGRPRRQAIWGSSPLMAASFIVIFAMILISLLNIPGQIADMSAILSLQVAALVKSLYLRMTLIALTCLIGGAAWMHLAYRSSRLKRMQENQL